jgi:hypothetical protein
MFTLSMMSLFACLGAWWGWKVTGVRLQTGTGPQWRRPAHVGRRVHAQRVRWRLRLWRLAFAAKWIFLGAAGGYGVVWAVGFVRGFLSDFM